MMERALIGAQKRSVGVERFQDECHSHIRFRSQRICNKVLCVLRFFLTQIVREMGFRTVRRWIQLEKLDQA